MGTFKHKTFLFLDDIRYPENAFCYTGRQFYLDETWVIVRSYNEFVKHIELNGLPDIISFDHDLADEHYAPQEYWKSREVLEKYYEEQTPTYTEKTGYDCAKWLIEYCLDKQEKLPDFYCHSMNPVGLQNIMSILDQFKKTQNEK
ncbi:MAG: cyclic-phosphate processing receiver domain-containing protein [bacterium]